MWILGQFGDRIEDSPYILEKMLVELKELNSPEFTAQLFQSVFKLFFIRAPEVKKLLAAIFQEIMTNGSDTILKQRAVFLYRAMQTDIQLARQIADTANTDFTEFFEEKNDEVRERLFLEFNSLSIVYQKPSERFLKDAQLKQSMASEKKYFPDRKRKRGLRIVDGGADEEEEAADASETLLSGDKTVD